MTLHVACVARVLKQILASGSNMWVLLLTPKKTNKNTGRELNQHGAWARMALKSVNPSLRW